MLLASSTVGTCHLPTQLKDLCRAGDATGRVEQTTARSSGLRGAASSKSFGTRTLMSFRGCTLSLGCTILLKGSSANQLAVVKKVLRVSVYSQAQPHFGKSRERLEKGEEGGI